MSFTTPGQTRASRATVGSPRRAGLALAMCLATLASFATTALAAQPPVGLGTADSFAVLAGSTVTNTGPSVINGDLGLSPGTSVTGFGGSPNGTVNGTTHIADAVASQAKTDLNTAYSDAAGRTPFSALPAELGGLLLTPGVYRASSAVGLTRTVTLDAQGDPSAVFIFQVGSALTTASASRVSLINGAQPCNVFWQIGSSATLGSASVFAGNILAAASISLNDGVTVDGRTLALTGAVTLINDTITRATCAAPTPTPPSAGSPGTSPAAGSPAATPVAASPAADSPVVASPPVTPAVAARQATPATVAQAMRAKRARARVVARRVAARRARERRARHRRSRYHRNGHRSPSRRPRKPTGFTG